MIVVDKLTVVVQYAQPQGKWDHRCEALAEKFPEREVVRRVRRFLLAIGLEGSFLVKITGTYSKLNKYRRATCNKINDISARIFYDRECSRFELSRTDLYLSRQEKIEIEVRIKAGVNFLNNQYRTRVEYMEAIESLRGTVVVKALPDSVEISLLKMQIKNAQRRVDRCTNRVKQAQIKLEGVVAEVQGFEKKLKEALSSRTAL